MTTEDIVKGMKERLGKVDLSQDWEMADSYLGDYLSYEKLTSFIESELLTALKLQKETTRKEIGALKKDKNHHRAFAVNETVDQALQVSSLR